MIKISTTILVVAEASATISISRLRDINDVLPAHLVEQQFPAFIREDYPKMVEFTRAYYDYMAQTENGRIKTLRNIDETSGDYLNYLQNEFLYNAAKPNFQQDFASEDFIRFSRQFYATKGTEESIKFLFRAQTAQEVDIEYPSELIFKASTARWFQEQSVKIVMTVDSIPATYFIGNYLTIKNSKGEEQTVEVSNVVDVTAKTLQTEVSTVFEVFFTTELIIDVAPGDTLFGTNFYSTIIPSLVDVQIVNAGTNFKVGQVIELDSVDGSGAIAVITNTLPGGVIRNLKIIRFGLNYTTNFYLNIVPDGIVVDSSDTFTASSTATFSEGIIDKTEGFFESQSILRSDYVLNNSPGSSPNYTYPGYIGSYVSQSTNRQVFFLEKNYSGLLFCKIGAVCNYSGKYLDQTGIPSNEGVLQDNDYYQDFSYVIRSAIDIENYRDTIKALAHPAGFKMFGSVSIDNEFESETTLSTATVGSDVRVTDFDFLTSETLDRRISFTRTGTATRYNSSGLLETVAANTPRFDYDPVTLAAKGLLIEEARTNLLKYSSEFDNNSVWAKINFSITPNAIIAPDGTLTADLQTATATATAALYQAFAITINTYYTASAYFKKGTAPFWSLSFSDNINSGASLYINSSTFATTPTSFGGWTSGAVTVSAVGNDWYRVTFTALSNSDDVLTTLYATQANTTANTATAGQTVYVWGAQVEAGSFATSYIPSTNTFTSRASTATYYGSDGLIKTAASNVARYNYNPANLTIAPTLLLEAAATNLLTYSEQFDNAAWGKNGSSVLANSVTAPDGSMTGDTLVNTAGIISLVTQGITVTPSSTNNYYATAYVKIGAGPNTNVTLNVYYVGNAEDNVTFFLEAGTASGAPYANEYICVSVGGGWYRIGFRINQDSTGTRTNIAWRIWVGQRSLGTTSDTLPIWGAQLEAGSFPTSYIPTTTTQLTRAADVSTSAAAARGADTAVVTGSNFSSWFNPLQGTIYAEYSRTNLSPTVSVASFENSSTNYIKFISGTSAAANQRFDVMTSGSNEASLVMNATENAGIVIKAAGAYKSNDIAAAAYNIVSTDTAATLPTGLTRLGIGTNYNSTFLNGYVRKLTYYPIRLDNDTMRTLTAPANPVISTQDYSFNVDFIGNTVSVST